jgi:hypothetical protein
MALLPGIILPQEFERKHPPHFEKIEELRKLKLIESLDMDEETTLRFFARQNEHRVKMKQLQSLSDELLNKMESELKADEKTKSLKTLINEYLLNEEKINEERKAFIKSLDDILEIEQVSKLIVFEKRFNEEMRNILFKERLRRKRN